MPDIVMPHAASSTSKVDMSHVHMTNRVPEMRRHKDRVQTHVQDGFSDTDTDSEDGDNERHVDNSAVNGNVNSTKPRQPISRITKTGTKDWKFTSSNLMKRRNSYIEEKKKAAEKEQFKETSENSEQHDDDVRYTYSDLEPIMAGQSVDGLHIPIMSPPPPLPPTPRFSFQMTNSSVYSRPISLSFLHAGEKLTCGFDNELNANAKRELLSISEDRKLNHCHCSGGCAMDDSLAGWERSEKSGKSKPGKRRKKNPPIDSSTFLRLTGALNGDKDDPVAFQYYEDSKKYIERYRFFHAVGNICRPKSEIVKVEAPMKKDIDNEPYFKNLKPSTCAMASEVDLYSLISTAKSKKAKPEAKRPASSKSSSSVNEKAKSEDEDSNEDDSGDVKPFSMKDRGKTLNLAPVRECMVPDLIPTDNFDQYQQNYIELNQYLNLITPPSSGKNLQFQIDVLKEKRLGNRIINMGDNNLFPACTPRRGARPLRLGSAEFVKPGSDDTEPRWSNEVKPFHPQSFQRASTFHSTVPGNLIVGSTVTQSNHSSAKSRHKNSGKSSPFVTFSKEQTAYSIPGKKPQTPPHHVYGKKYKPCERVNDLTMPKDRHGRFPYTHTNNGNNDKMLSQCRTVMAVDLKEGSSLKREKLKQITLDVNHLGIRGKTFQHNQITVLYNGKDRRTATVKS